MREWCSSASDKWLQVDLGANCNITEFVIAHANVGGELVSYNTKAFDISVSTDNATWTKAVTVTGNSSGVTVHSVKVTARYVKLAITTPTQGTDRAARIYEFEVNGTAVK